jgi:ribonuclease HI
MFTDGASKGNPGPGGFGAIVVSKTEVFELGGREAHTTNNRMELRAAIEALTFVQKTLHATRYTFCVYSDSSYLVNGITTWVHGWQRNNWMTATKKPVENRDFWEKLAALSEGLDIVWERVTGHADTAGNARADEIASAFAEGKIPKLFSGPTSAYALDLAVIGSTGHRQRSRKIYSYVSCVDGLVQTHHTWDECKKRVDGKRGARFKKVFSEEEETQLVAEFSKS